MPTSPNLLPVIMQQALQRAHPQPLPSNLVITVVEEPVDGAVAGDAVTTTARPTPFCWGGLFANAANMGALSYYSGWKYGSGQYA